jgi:hypothetical protein
VQRPPRPLSPRQARGLAALLSGPQTVQQIGSVAGCNNPPDLISKLRSRIGLVIPCVFSSVTDRDGCSVERGIYSLTGADRAKAEAFLLVLAHAGRATA